jgi:hypothetical protein
MITTEKIKTIANSVTEKRGLLVNSGSGRKPVTVARLNDWQYLERSLQRLLAAWGRNFCEWDDKTTLHRQVWEHAEAVRRIRERLADFPGSAQHMDAPVSQSLEELGNTVLLAPSFEDALDGIYQLLTNALMKSYLDYAQAAHPVHDAPTIAMLHQIIGIKEGQRLWFRGYRRRHPHTIDAEYSARIETAIARCAHLSQAMPVDETNPAQPVGTRTDFRLPAVVGRPASTIPRYNFMPYLEADFAASLETRRLFWCYGYMLEQGLAEDQLRWIYDGHWMPWEFLQDISRHLWDESRHGDSGHSRLLDFGITIDEIGFPQSISEGDNLAEPLSRHELYERIFSCGMIAETGHFVVKREAYDDFKAGGDLESAEMMLFDIIDETAHVQYAHKWLPVLAEGAGVDNSDYRERGAKMREQRQREFDERVKGYADLPRNADDPNYAFYQKLLQIMRDKKPLANAASCPPRTRKPM